jgi:transposase
MFWGMFIKKTLKTDPKSGKTYSAYHLVESVRTEKGPRQRTLLYMGAEIDLPEGDHKLLAQRIEDIITGQQSLVPYPENIEHLAQNYASQVIRRLSSAKDIPENLEKEKLDPEFINIDINSIEKSEPRTVGTEHLLLQMANQLELPKQLQELGLSKTDASIALGSIIARAVSPDSERSTFNWLCNHSGLSELLDFDFKKSSLDKLYQVSDKLLSHKAALENHLETIECKFHGYKSTIALYDLTNTYMEGQAKSNPKAAFGVSKEKRNDCPLVTMGLVMNEHGFLNRTSILPGNASEPKTLEEMIENLNAHQSLFKPTIILDAGIATKDNLAWLRKNEYKYIVSARQDAPSIDLEGELVSVGDLNNLVKAALIKSEENSEEKWLYCESEAKAAVASKMKHSFRTRFEEELKKLSDGLVKPKGRKKLTKVIERLGRLKEKHKRISGCYEVNVIASEDGSIAIALEWKVVEEKMSDKLTGSYFLRTNLVAMEAKELWQLYNTLRGVEDAFRFMKSSLGLRPVYHQKEHRVDGHLWITILAYHLIQNCLYQLNKQGLNHQWKTIRKIMMGRVRVTMQAKTDEGKTLYHRSTTKAEGEQKEIYRALEISPQILKAHKIIL